MYDKHAGMESMEHHLVWSVKPSAELFEISLDTRSDGRDKRFDFLCVENLSWFQCMEMSGSKLVLVLLEEMTQLYKSAGNDLVQAIPSAREQLEAVEHDDEAVPVAGVGLQQGRRYFCKTASAQLYMAKPARSLSQLTDRYFDDIFQSSWLYQGPI
jgi:hypothetical protein